jgi:hypothetical protein
MLAVMKNMADTNNTFFLHLRLNLTSQQVKIGLIHYCCQIYTAKSYILQTKGWERKEWNI